MGERRLSISLTDLARSIFLLTIPVLIIMMLCLEFSARVLLPTSDVPDVLFDQELGNHFRPNQRGTFVAGPSSEIRAEYRINDQGWNSPYDYGDAPPDNAFRVAVVGDSYVEAIQVDFDKSFPYLLERQVNGEDPGKYVHVRSYGHSGANLTQYYKVAAHVLTSYKPDLLIVNVVHNDFPEIFEEYSRIDNWALRDSGDALVFREPRRSPRYWLKRILSKSAVVRYAVINLKILERFAGLKRMLKGTRPSIANFNANGVDSMVKATKTRRGVNFLLDEFRMLALETQILFLIDGDRSTIYRGRNPYQSPLYQLNELLLTLAEERNIAVIDMTAPFLKDWQLYGQGFDWPRDYHWNERGHEVVSSTIRSFLLENKQSLFHQELNGSVR